MAEVNGYDAPRVHEEWCGGDVRRTMAGDFSYVKPWCSVDYMHKSHWLGTAPERLPSPHEGARESNRFMIGTKTLCNNCGKLIEFEDRTSRDPKWNHVEQQSGSVRSFAGYRCDLFSSIAEAEPSDDLFVVPPPEKEDKPIGPRLVRFSKIIPQSVHSPFEEGPRFEELAIRSDKIIKIELGKYETAFKFVPEPERRPQANGDWVYMTGCHRYWNATAHASCLVITTEDDMSYMVVGQFDKIIANIDNANQHG